MKFINYISMAMAIAALASCSNNELDVDLQDAPSISVHATVGDSYSRTNPMGTAEEQKAFVEGDQLMVSTEGQSAATYTLAGGKWSAAQTLLWTLDKMTFKAWYPADAAFDSYALPVDQTTATEGNAFSKIAQADYMTCTATQAKADQLNLTFQRQTARVVVNVTFNKEFEGVNPAITSFVVRANRQAGAGTENLAEFKAYQQGNTFTALVAPTTAKAEETFMKLTVTYSGNQTKELTVKGIKALDKGKSHEYNVAVGLKTGVAITNVSITDWTDGTTFDNVTPQKAQPIVDATKHSIMVLAPGLLTTEHITAALADGTKALTISGSLNGADMKVIREATGCPYEEFGGSTAKKPLVTDLDLTDSRIIASGHVYCEYNDGMILDLYKITEDNTWGDHMFSKSALKSIKMPKSVTSYSLCTFSLCSDLANVHWGESTPATLSRFMFSSCSSLVSITIPETVTNLGEELFDGCSNLTSITIACDRKATSAGTSQTGIIGINPNTTNIDLKLHPSFKNDVTFNEQGQPMFEGKQFKSITDLNGNPFTPATTNP